MCECVCEGARSCALGECANVFECCVQMCTYVSVSVYLCELEFVVYIYVTESGMCVCVWCGYMYVHLCECI